MDLKVIFPNRNIRQVERLNSLSSNKIFRVSFSDPDGDVIIKSFPEDYKERMKKEIDILRILERHKIPSPKLLLIDYDKMMIVESFLKGKTLLDIMLQKDTSDSMMKMVGRELKKIHNIKDSELWQDTKQIITNKDEWLFSVIRRNELNLNDIKNQKIVNILPIERIKKYLEEFVVELKKSEIFLCPIHGDFNPANILIENSHITGILDFENHRIAHNLNELGIIYYWFKFYSKEHFFQILLDGYSKNINKKIIEGYYLMQIIGALSFLIKNELDKKAVLRLKEMLNEFILNME